MLKMVVIRMRNKSKAYRAESDGKSDWVCTYICVCVCIQLIQCVVGGIINGSFLLNLLVRLFDLTARPFLISTSSRRPMGYSERRPIRFRRRRRSPRVPAYTRALSYRSKIPIRRIVDFVECP